ncbi:MAG: hypothetical protein WAX77_02305 [Methylococcaceae bacterium]
MNNEIKEAAIQQINVTYIREEDRLLLRIAVSDETELAIWLTRRIVKNLWDLLNDNQVIAAVAPDLKTPQVLQQSNTTHNPHSPQTQNLLQEFAKEAATQKLNFTEQYQPRATLNNKTLLLVNDCQITAFNEHNAFLELLCMQEQTVKVALNSTLLLALVNILKLAIQQAEWNFTSLSQSVLISQHQPNLLH